MASSSRFCGNKAGMATIDKTRINQIIDENTSQNYGNHEQKRAKRIEERVQRNRNLLANITQEQIEHVQNQLSPIITELESKRRLDRYKVHFDMDAFFAAVECRDNPKLRTVPMAVGGDAMLSTSNYLARKFGVRSAMPGFIAKKLCPQIVIVPGSFGKYKKESHTIRSIFENFDPNVSMGSLDEAYLDLTDFLAKRTSPVRCRRVRYTGECVCRLPLLGDEEEAGSLDGIERLSEKCSKCGMERVSVSDFLEFGIDVNSVVQQIRFEVEQATGLTCSAGIAANGRLAKICSDLNKPNGQFKLENDRESIIDFMRSLPIRKVPGIGPVSEAVLKELGVHTCGDIFEKRAVLHFLFYEHYFRWLLSVSLGISSGDTDQEGSSANEGNPKSTSIERTFAPIKDLSSLLPTVRKLCGKLIDSLPSDGIVGGRAATLKIKFATFDVVTRCKSVDFPINTVEILYPIMEGILKRELKDKDIAVRLLGVRLSNLVFSNADSDGDHKSPNVKGVQKSLMGFVRPSTSAAPPILVELDSDDADEEEVAPELEGEEEEDVLDTSMERMEEGQRADDLDGEENVLGEEANKDFDEMSMEGTSQNEAMDEDERDEELDEEEVVFVGEVGSEGNRKDGAGRKKTRQEAKKRPKPKKSEAAKQARKRNSSSSGKRPKGVRDLRDYFPTIL